MSPPAATFRDMTGPEATHDTAAEEPRDDRPGTREELRALLEAAGLGPQQTRVWLDSPTALLSGLIPADAITDPATAARARHATERLIARLPDPAPSGVHLTAVTIREPGTYLLELTFAWPGGNAVRHWDAEPHLWASRAHEPLAHDYDRFTQLHIANRTLTWPARNTGEQDARRRARAPLHRVLGTRRTHAVARLETPTALQRRSTPRRRPPVARCRAWGGSTGQASTAPTRSPATPVSPTSHPAAAVRTPVTNPEHLWPAGHG